MFSDHIPEDNSEFSGCGGDGGVSSFSVGDAFEEGRQGMGYLISDAVSGLAQGYGQAVFSFWGSTADNAATAQFVIGYEPKPTGKLFGGGKTPDIVSHIAEKTKDGAVADAGDLEKISFQMSEGQLADVKGRRVFI